ncbi:MAG TPA: HEPN domain-containing protein [Candidatus Acetothermia bacterium]|nr:HEPN domain-containing protein [Candidatus Acetothermia bacterium]
MTREIEELLQKSQRSLQAAKRLLKAKDYDFAISRAYYSMFYSAQAALLSKSLEYSSHAAVVARFGEHFIKANLLPRKLGKALSKAFRLRMASDYDVSMPSAVEAKSTLRNAQEFIWAISRYLSQEAED